MRRQAATGASTTTDRWNRAGLFMIGVLLAGAGGYGLARGWKAFGADPAGEPLLSDSLRQFVSRNQAQVWIGATLLALLVALVGFRWLRAQLAAAAPRRLDLTSRGDGGTTEIIPAGAANALAGEIERYGSVANAAARLSGEPDAPHVDIRVDVVDGCDVNRLRARIEDEALTRFCQALQLDSVGASLEFRLTEASGRRVQ